MDAVSCFQLSGLCGLLFISIVCCDLKSRIYFLQCCCVCFFLASWRKINRTLSFTSHKWDVLQTRFEFRLMLLWISTLHSSNLRNVKESHMQLKIIFLALCVEVLKYRNLFPVSRKACHWNIFKSLALMTYSKWLFLKIGIFLSFISPPIHLPIHQIRINIWYGGPREKCQQ